MATTVRTKHKYTANNTTSSTDRPLALQNLILEAQSSAEKEALQRVDWFISDRSGFDPLVYAREHVSPQAVVEMRQLPFWMEERSVMETSLIVVCEAGMPWLMDDSVRLMPDNEDAWMKPS